MASPDRSKRKILKAKKTMPSSCRKQVEILNKSKNVEALRTAAIGSKVPSGSQNLSTELITSKCKHSENVDSSFNSNKNSVFSQKSIVVTKNLIKPVEEIVDSDTRLEYIDEQVVCRYQKPRKTLDSPSKLFIQRAEDSQNTSETHLEYQTKVKESFFEHEENCNLKPIYCTPIILSDIVQNTLNGKRIDEMVSNLEANSNSESLDGRQNDILNPNSHFVPVEKTSSLVNLVNSSCYTANSLKTEESCRTCHFSISNCESTDSKWQSLLNTDANNSHNQKKRMLSENKENVKRMKTSEPINENICVALEKQTAVLEQSVEKKKLDFVIDLTKEGLSNCNTGIPASIRESPLKTVLSSKDITPVAGNTTEDFDSFEHLPPLPEPPPLLPELVDKIGDTLPPQKPELKVKRVLKPMGIALTWNISKINPRCAPVESYHLFLCHENSTNKLIWKKIGEIKALPLPMACTLSQFLASDKYYFTIQSKDIFGRYGPFCDIKSIPGFSENLT
ncbi:Activating transcription factor 7-interacting protein 2 [Sciurus carolinensis]|uniref:Activating transcription factor 7-interacting protein 2 n=1 Tax=Sciurus carolinensis TaxID=30640 RepID=A0AA41N8L1_SCICA|nr:Activating transcription factor 7-interacting protein 2 [Sciurus carolinensis]